MINHQKYTQKHIKKQQNVFQHLLNPDEEEAITAGGPVVAAVSFYIFLCREGGCVYI